MFPNLFLSVFFCLCYYSSTFQPAFATCLAYSGFLVTKHVLQESVSRSSFFLIIKDGSSKSITETVRSCLSIWSSKQHRPWRWGSHLSVKLTALFLFSVAFYCCWNYILLLDVNILRILLINFYLTCITKDWKMCQIMVNNSKLSWRKTVNLYMHWIFHLQNNVNANFQYCAALPFTFLVPRSVERNPFQQLVSGR